METVVRSLIALVALAFLIGAPAFSIRRFAFLRRAASTRGAVVDMRVQHDGEGTRTRRFTIRYRVLDGREFTIEQTLERNAKVGDDIEVLYDPANPERAYVKFGALYVWTQTVILLAIGLLVALFAYKIS